MKKLLIMALLSLVAIQVHGKKKTYDECVALCTSLDKSDPKDCKKYCKIRPNCYYNFLHTNGKGTNGKSIMDCVKEDGCCMKK